MDDRKCTRCGHEEFRIDGYCSIYCRDMAEVEDELKHERQLRQQAEAELERVTADWKREMQLGIDMQDIQDRVLAILRDTLDGLISAGYGDSGELQALRALVTALEGERAG